ncbi:hypothetical protein [Bacillus salipaludis]|uniref:hypothetical protein n=1 Tax=Bacillus salipaludis TaxID=2547811 RepID=UPI002E21F157|nr:hypothetical protein [Bacillus salipaludis]
MVTLSFILIALFLPGLLSLFDMRLFGYSFMSAIHHLIFSEIAAGRYIVIIGATIGFISSIFIDVRIYLSKRKGKNTEGNQVS